MIKKIVFYSSLFLFIACGKVDKKKKVKPVQKVTAVKSVDYNALKPYLFHKDDTTHIINFWATWCAPCVKELPYFEKIKEQYASKNVKVVLVSLDFPKQVDKKLIPFINKNNLQSEVVLLDDVNEDFWIKAIDSTWSGAIPATLIYNKNTRKFYEQSFDYKALENELKTFLKP